MKKQFHACHEKTLIFILWSRFIRCPAAIAAILFLLPPLFGMCTTAFYYSINMPDRTQGAFACYAVESLDISSTDILNLSEENPVQVASEIQEDLSQAETAIVNNDVRQARQQISLIEYKIEKHTKIIDKNKKKEYKGRLSSLKNTVKDKIDSLIQVNLMVLKKKGQTAGIEFRQHLSIDLGLSETELIDVDVAIEVTPRIVESEEALEQNSSSERPESTVVSIQKEAALPEKAPETKPPIKPVTIAPVQPSPTPPPKTAPVVSTPPLEQVALKSTKPDAIKQPIPEQTSEEGPEQKRSVAISLAVKIGMLLDQGKVQEAMSTFSFNQTNMQRYLDASMYKKVKAMVETAVSLDQDRRARVSLICRNIENLLDQDRSAEANAEFTTSRDELKKSLQDDEFRTLQEKVRDAYDEFTRTQTTANVKARDIRELCAKSRVAEASMALEKSRSTLSRGLPKDEFDSLVKEVAGEVNAMQDKRKSAALRRKEIASLIEDGKVTVAYTLFNDNRALLEQNLDKNSFSSLALSVNRAQKEFIARQAKASAEAARIDSLIDCAKTDKAYGIFNRSKNDVRRDLNDDIRFFKLKDRLFKAYNELIEKRQQALRSEQIIVSLIDRKEGRKAYDLFSQNAALLKEYLEPASKYKKLSAAVDASRTDYELHMKSSRSAMSSIKGLLDQKHIEQAYATFGKAEEDFDHYLEDDKTVEVLGKRVHEAYATLIEKRQWANNVARQVERLIEQGKGDESSLLYKKERPELVKYSAPQTITRLDASTVRANTAFIAAKNRAETCAGHIRGLLTQKQIEDAYTVFDTSEPMLKRYLAPERYDNLKTRVEESNGMLQDKKRDAFNIINTIDNLIGQNEGDSAYVLFSRNKSFLAAYVKPSICNAIGSRANKAKIDYANNRKLSLKMADRLRNMIIQEQEEAAYTTFNDKRDYLEHYLTRTGFMRLDSDINIPYEKFMQKRKEARAVAGTLRRMIKRNHATIAYTEFNNRQKNFVRYLEKEEYHAIKKTIEDAYSSSIRGRRETRETVDKIDYLIDKNLTPYAYSLFKDSRQILELYLPQTEFTNLQNKVESTYNEWQQERKKVMEYAKDLKKLVADNKLLDAYNGFQFNHSILKEYLTTQAYTDLEKTVVGTYNDARSRAMNDR